MGKRRNKNTKRRKKDSLHSSIEQHKRQGKRLIPPLAQLPMHLQSWRDERLPEMLWAASLTNLPRDHYLELFRRVADEGRKLGKRFDGSVYHSDLAKLDNDTFDSLLGPVISDKEAMAKLPSLMFFEYLPDHKHWERQPFTPPTLPTCKVRS